MAPIPYDRLRFLEQPDLSPLPAPKTHPACQDELCRLYPNEASQAVLRQQLARRVQHWNEDQLRAMRKTEWFKPEGDIQEGGVTYPVFSMRFNHNAQLGNLRILYLTDSNEIILMHAFQEKRRNDYQHAKEVVRQRLKEG